MAKDTSSRPVSGEALPPERHDIFNEARRQLPYANPPELLQRMGGFFHRWSMYGKTAAANEIAVQIVQLYRSYEDLYATMARLEHARIEHGRAINDLRYLDDILREDNRRRQAAYALATQRDEVAKLQLQQQIDMLKHEISMVGQPRGEAPDTDAEVPDSPAEQLKRAAAQRGELRKTVDELIATIQREAGDKGLSSELEEEVQRLRDDAERLLLHSASER